MEYVNLGQTGLKVSRIGLGCMTFGSPSWAPWVLPKEAAIPIIEIALSAGINFFDTADVYSGGTSEEIVGEVLLPRLPRSHLVIATKLGQVMTPEANDRGLSRKHIFESIDASLRRLKTDYVDLYYVHRLDPITPMEESLEALNDIVRAGKVRYLGASSMFAWQFMKALGMQRANGWARFVAMQNHYNLLYREEEREMLPLCRSEGIGVVPWSPLARGRLAGNKAKSVGVTIRGQTDKVADALYSYSPSDDDAVIEAVRRVSARHGVSMAKVAYAWVASRPGITGPIVGISKPEQLDDAIQSINVALSAEDVVELEAPYHVKPVAGHI